MQMISQTDPTLNLLDCDLMVSRVGDRERLKERLKERVKERSANSTVLYRSFLQNGKVEWLALF